MIEVYSDPKMEKKYLIIYVIIGMIYKVETYKGDDKMRSQLLERNELNIICAKSVCMTCGYSLYRGNKFISL